MKRTSSAPSNLSESLHRQLSSYALAAGAGVLALVQPTQGRVVYTPAHRRIPFRGILYLDINHDSSRDFKFSNLSITGDVGTLLVSPEGSANAVWGTSWYVSALRPGVAIGSSGKFGKGHGWMCRWSRAGSMFGFSGPWCGVQGLYLGLKFQINGQAHYGWARLKVADINYGFHAVLTGYAYETIPNKPIIAGKTHGKDVITVEPGSLGHLALGRK